MSSLPEQKRLQPFTAATLSGIPVAGAGGLRALLKAEYAANNLSDDYLRSHGMGARSFGMWVSGVNKETAMAILLGHPGSAVEASPVLPTEAPAVSAMPAANPQAVQAMNALLAALGGVNPESIRAQIQQEMRPAVEGFNAKLREGSEKVDVALRNFSTWQQDAQKGVDALRAEMLAGRSVTIEVKRDNGDIVKVGRQHYLFPLVLKIAAARCHAYLVGPAGSGKTSICHKVADALGLAFSSLSVCQQSTKTDLLGYMNAVGAYVSTCFREAFEKGGVFVLDEVDNGNANVIAVLNAALANDSMSFPDGMVKRHADFVLIAAGNTYGTGADRLYVGRNQLDAATLDRFAFVDFPYDEGFEAELCGVKGKGSPACDIAAGGSVTADGWLAFVGKVRAACDKLKLRHVVSPRASIYGVRLASHGIGRKWLERMLIFKGLDAATIQKVRAAL